MYNSHALLQLSVDERFLWHVFFPFAVSNTVSFQMAPWTYTTSSAYLESDHIYILFSFSNYKALIKLIISAFWAKVPTGNGFALITLSIVVTAYPAWQFPCLTKLHLLVNQEYCHPMVRPLDLANWHTKSPLFPSNTVLTSSCSASVAWYFRNLEEKSQWRLFQNCRNWMVSAMTSIVIFCPQANSRASWMLRTTAATAHRHPSQSLLTSSNCLEKQAIAFLYSTSCCTRMPKAILCFSWENSQNGYL